MPKGGCAHIILYAKWVFGYVFGFFIDICLILIDFLHFWEILGIFGAQILGGSWGWITNFRAI
jgi:hypothetical protein